MLSSLNDLWQAVETRMESVVSLLESGRRQRWSQQMFFEKPSWAQRLFRYVLVRALVSSVVDSSCVHRLRLQRLSTNSSFKMRMDGNIREMEKHRSLPTVGTKSNSLCTKLAHCISCHLAFDVPRRFDEQHCPFRPPTPKSTLQYSPHWLLASHLSCSVSLSSSPHLIFMALTPFIIRAPVCWYIHHPSSYSLLDATYVLNPWFEYPWFVSLPYIIKVSRHTSRRSFPSSHPIFVADVQSLIFVGFPTIAECTCIRGPNPRTADDSVGFRQC